MQNQEMWSAQRYGLPGGKKNKFHGTFQMAEGAPSDLLPFIVVEDKGKIKFKVSDDNYGGNFVGKVSKDKLTGIFTFSNGVDMELSLPRKKSYWDAE
jgi:hypothetical protein